ncbi:MAG: transcription termination/antitermination protein NusA [Clostridia bacterium]|nr:transcription termination/antitermination protein NusA [Clostridia bacterium]
MVNKEFFEALRLLEEERGIPQDKMIAMLEQGLTAAYKKHLGEAKLSQVKLNPEKHTIKFYSGKMIVEVVEDQDKEISLADAKEIKKSYKLGDIVWKEENPKNFNRIAVQTAKQVVVQNIKEIEKQAISSDIAEKEGKLIVANVRRTDGENIYLEIGGTTLEGLLTKRDCLPDDSFRIGDKIKVFVRHIRDDYRGAVIQVTRANPAFVKKLLEMEVPEIANGDIEIVNIVREPGLRTKVAVKTNIQGLDAVGACIGNKGMRINTIINELHGEKIDIINYSDDAREFIISALSPATVNEVYADLNAQTAQVLVPENKLSLAIGKGGHNVRLAAKLTGYKLDVKGEKEYTHSNDVVIGNDVNIIVDDIDDDLFDDIDD